MPADDVNKSKPAKRELKSAKRKDGVPAIQKAKKKRAKWPWIIVGIVVLFLALGFMPRVGTIRYGICKAFIELNDPYPGFLEYVQAYENDNVVTIDYNRTDAFGQRTLNQMKCTFNLEENPNEIAKADLNGRANVYPLEDAANIAKFNLGVPALLQNKPKLTMPRGLPDDIKDYK